jgi:hypothetical protein
VFGSNVAVESYLGRVATIAILMRAVDGFPEFFSRPLNITCSLEMSDALSELAKSGSDLTNEFSQTLFNSIDFSHEIVRLHFQGLQSFMVL